MIQQTSLMAYQEMLPNITKTQNSVYAVLVTLHEATNAEIAGFLGWSINRVTPRVLELRQKGLVVPFGRRACKVTHNMSNSWKVVKNGF